MWLRLAREYMESSVCVYFHSLIKYVWLEVLPDRGC